jgi:hypothetical protein
MGGYGCVALTVAAVAWKSRTGTADCSDEETMPPSGDEPAGS